MFLQFEKDDVIIRKYKITKEKIKIGRTPDCDILIELGPYNSTIVKTLDVLLINDGNYDSSLYGTYLNGQQIHQTRQLRKGDVISFEPSRRFKIVVKDNVFSDLTAVRDMFSGESLSRTLILGLTGVCGALIMALIFSFLYFQKSDVKVAQATNSLPTKNSLVGAIDLANKAGNEQHAKDAGAPVDALVTDQIENIVPYPGEISLEGQLKSEIVNFLRKISTNNSRPINIPDRGSMVLIQAEIDKNTGSRRLGNIFNGYNSDPGRSDLAVLSRKKKLPVGLVLASCLIESESEDLVRGCYREIEKIFKLSITFGTGDSNSSLLIIAAMEKGVGSTKNHPLFDKIKSPDSDQQEARNIWFLYSKKAVGESIINKVIEFIALGVIAQNPRKYQIDADPIL